MSDDNFLVDLKRALGIAEGLIRAGASFKWSIQATTNLTARLTVEDLRLLRRFGLHQICQGIDTASAAVVKLLDEVFQALPDVYQSIQHYIQAHATPLFHILLVFP